MVGGLDVGGNKVLDETLTREEALIAHTRSNAYLFFKEKSLCSLEVGKQADLMVLDRDYITVPACACSKNTNDIKRKARRLEPRPAVAQSCRRSTEPGKSRRRENRCTLFSLSRRWPASSILKVMYNV